MEEEVYLALSSLGPNKFPGSDGFAAEFFKFFWPTIKFDMMRLIHDFYTSWIINVKLSETYIFLIPKKVDSKFVSDFKPISLIPCAYKIMVGFYRIVLS